MRWAPLSLAVAFALLAFGPARAAEEKADAGFVKLFDGKDFAGWSFVLKGKDAKPGTTFTIADGVIVCDGKQPGYIVSDKSLKNYVIKYDWKYARPRDLEDEEKFLGNSGLLVHIQGLPEKGVWPRCLEIQGMNKNHGMLLNVSGAKGTGYKFDAAALKKARKPVGEWNTTEATLQDGKVTVKVNGAEVASGKTDLTEGPIGFQSEGAEIHFRNIRVKELK
jgi:Domain of Unknown Function (DUF1080)